MTSVALYEGDCKEVLKGFRSDSVEFILTDPPYFLDGLDDSWSKGKDPRPTGAVRTLPSGMKFDRRQGEKLEEFLNPVNSQLFRVLSPGGFMVMFSSPRLFHRLALSAENNGFEIRDQYIWHYKGKAQSKAFSMDHFIRKREDFTDEQKESLIRRMEGRKTPQLRPQFESLLCAQKPKEGTFVDNWMEYETGLVDTRVSLDGKFPSTLMEVEKPESKHGHLTAKPEKLLLHLIQLFSCKGQTVLDPFLGSGTTCLAARSCERNSIGIEIDKKYMGIARRRLQ